MEGGTVDFFEYLRGDLWEEDIRILGGVMDTREIERVGGLEGLSVGVGAANDEALFGILGGSESLREVGHDHYCVRGVRPRELADDDILALGERTADGLESHPAHDDRVAGRRLSEIFHVARKVPKQGVLASDRHIVGDGYYNTFLTHTATGALIAGQGS